MSAFNEYHSVETLRKIAQKPVDLSKGGCLCPKRMEEMMMECPNLKLFYGTERVNEKTMETLFELANEAGVHEKMLAMQNGEMINKIEGFESENRMVLHTAMRDFFDRQAEGEQARQAAALAYAEMEKLKSFLDGIKKEDYTDMIQVGIGGSELGPKAIYLALEAFNKPGKRVHFISNVDPDDAANVIRRVNLSKTLVVIVSKSGTTLETLTNEELIRKKFQEEGLSPKNHFLAVTGKGSPMDNPEMYRKSFYIWDYVGGRYSATSMVGCVMLAFALGMEKLLDFLRGANSMDKVALEQDPKKNLPLLSALLGIWNHNFLGHPTTAIIPYSQAMSRFPAHLQQCDMESNGKRIDKQGSPVDFWTGPIIWGEPGTNGQHSFYQLIHQGTIIVPVEFIGFMESQFGEDSSFKGTTSQEKLLSNLFAQSIGLATGQKSDNPNKEFPGNRPNRVLMAKKCDPYTMGAILSYFENKVAFQGFIWDINSFDQEGVQLGKVLANKIIDQFSKKNKEEEYEKDFPLGAVYIDHLKGL
ncbi:glucose-6-phosphate isomerase [Candidatus Neptunichlamydia sp. REUL1]|uniref:glucose-6-phosphate isomerase n=1 Tax=Candidatus Neptunichlamydia sp. REUL1 TaxID=3064277 RepID=UPI00292F9A8F|nr:glucose-6-phosphate isomerase [Candidatus Neptunochlamydia sp. REUL1]